MAGALGENELGGAHNEAEVSLSLSISLDKTLTLSHLFFLQTHSLSHACGTIRVAVTISPRSQFETQQKTLRNVN